MTKPTSMSSPNSDPRELFIRRVFARRVYDTETAKFVHVVCDKGGHLAFDFHAEYTAMYRTRRGTFFLAGQSGACGCWKAYRDGGYLPGQGIRVLESNEARRLLEQTRGPLAAYFAVTEDPNGQQGAHWR
ncbi:hypothetical protein [Bradyrhizobium genosp. P]|uniref:hypothetical protein n=1 Tax=Bradyrhizobium genosp. P TaxID=83641 RepID=UPI003CF82734